MRQRIENNLHVQIEGDVDMTTASNIEFYVRQGPFFRTYKPTVLSAMEMVVTIPYEDAMLLAASSVRLQFAFTDANGNPVSTDVEEVSTGEFLKEAGYDPV